jgi:phosphoribosylaminoimidazole-succinocarboxamide synthase
MSNTITTTNFSFPNQKSVYRGKVREVYNINDDLLVMVATDRLSAFDVVLPKEFRIRSNSESNCY